MDYNAIKIIPYSRVDYDFVYQVKKDCYKTYVEQNWGEWNEEKQREFFVEFIRAYANNIMVICLNDEKIGFYHGEDLDENSYEIGNICIIKEYQGNGIGTKILKNLIDANADKDIYLQYFKQNPVVNLYKRLGFEMCEEKQYHYKMVLKRK